MFGLVIDAGIIITLVTMAIVGMQLRTHPRGLVILFFAEMWERFSYYGMRGLLVFFMTQHFLFSDDAAASQYGSYTSLVYLVPLIGGMLADRLLGTRKAIAFGALLLVAGHTAMAIEGQPNTQILSYQGAKYEFNVEGRGADREVRLQVGDNKYDWGASTDGGLEIKGLPKDAPIPSVLPKGSYELEIAGRQPFFEAMFYTALSLIILGVGFLKANISAIVGQLYPKDDPRRDPGFTLYYYGINLGAFWAAILCGFLGQNIGWWAGFGAAGIGMALGFVVFVWGKPLLEGHGEPPKPEVLKQKLFGPINKEWAVYLGTIPALYLIYLLVQHNDIVGWMLSLVSIGMMIFFFIQITQKCTKEEGGRLILALILISASVVFWTLFEQAGTSLNLFAERNTNLALPGGGAMTAAQTQSFNSGFILMLVPVFSALWAFLGSRNMDPNPVLKFSIALLQVGLSFLILVWGAQFADAQYRIPLMFLIVAYLIQTTGELCLSPVGLSWMTKLSTPTVISTLMATWFLSSSWAQYLGGYVAKLASVETVAGQVLDPAAALATYVDVFGQLGWWTIGIGIALGVASPFLKKLAHGVK
ncbi:MAG: proton-dependent oligopeptide transporter POT family [Hyphomonadaceae bacterium]|nr:MAG: proton-dependent oligopeptide transporter POT family [Hyphomonadaceae bacterium]KAF0184256.1 MAG: proton-dependent oligopeptide transporter POT family [Hyphomonadaceae bacterium]